jgi:hypothetical protein
MKRIGLIALVMLPATTFAQADKPAATQPAATQPAATQPAAVRNLARYYGLVRNEFMRTEKGSIMLVPEGLKKIIAGIRAKAVEDRKAINADIADVTAEIRKADAEARAQKKKVLAERSKAEKIDNSNFRTNLSGQTKMRSYRLLDDANQARSFAGAAKADASRAKGDVSAAKAELQQLKKELASLSWAASPYARNMPPRLFWREQPEDIQKQLARVGISKEDFAIALKKCRVSETEFLDAAVAIDNKTHTAIDCADELRDYFEKRLPIVINSKEAGLTTKSMKIKR